MGKLKSLPPRLAMAPPHLSLARPPEMTRSQFRLEAQPWRAWYGLGRWKKLRWQVLVDSGFRCAKCAREYGNTALLVGDHITPHRGDPALFWDRANIQCLCKPCHDGAKQAEEKQGLF